MPAANPLRRSSMTRSRIMVEMLGSRASDTLVRSTYEIVYMISATGMIRSQRCCFIGSGNSPTSSKQRIGGPHESRRRACRGLVMARGRVVLATEKDEIVWGLEETGLGGVVPSVFGMAILEEFHDTGAGVVTVDEIGGPIEDERGRGGLDQPGRRDGRPRFRKSSRAASGARRVVLRRVRKCRCSRSRNVGGSKNKSPAPS